MKSSDLSGVGGDTAPACHAGAMRPLGRFMRRPPVGLPPHVTAVVLAGLLAFPPMPPATLALDTSFLAAPPPPATLALDSTSLLAARFICDTSLDKNGGTVIKNCREAVTDAGDALEPEHKRQAEQRAELEARAKAKAEAEARRQREMEEAARTRSEEYNAQLAARKAATEARESEIAARVAQLQAEKEAKAQRDEETKAQVEADRRARVEEAKARQSRLDEDRAAGRLSGPPSFVPSFSLPSFAPSILPMPSLPMPSGTTLSLELPKLPTSFGSGNLDGGNYAADQEAKRPAEEAAAASVAEEEARAGPQ